MNATEKRIDVAEWLVTVGETTQTIRVRGPQFVVERRAPAWTKWTQHLWEGKIPRNVAKRFDTLEEATKFACDLAVASEAVREAMSAADELLGRMVIT